MTNSSAFSIQNNQINTTVTVAPEQCFHYVHDDELSRISEMRSDLIAEICLASAGVFFGSVVPAIDGFTRFGVMDNPATKTDLASMMLCFTAFVVAVVTGLQWFFRARRQKNVIDEIRNRPKVPVHLVVDNG